MPARPARHPLANLTEADHAAPAGRSRHPIAPRPDAPTTSPVPAAPVAPRPRRPDGVDRVASAPEDVGRPSTAVGEPTSEDGSVATEYGLLAVVAATIVSVMLEWATGGGITSLLQAVMGRVSEVVGL